MPPQSPINENLDDIIERSVTRALVRIGIASDDDSAAIELQRDFSYLRDLRIGSQAIKNKGILALIGIIVTGISTLIWFGLSGILGKHS